MSRSLTLIALLLTATVSPLSPQTTDEEETTNVQVTKQLELGFSNGNRWQAVDRQSRIMWVQGIEEGMALMLREAYPHFSVTDRAVMEKKFKALLIQGFRTSDVVKQIDEFYEDSSNLRIPVVDAYKYTIRKMHGAKQRELEDYAAQLRQRYNR